MEQKMKIKEIEGQTTTNGRELFRDRSWKCLKCGSYHDNTEKECDCDYYEDIFN